MDALHWLGGRNCWAGGAPSRCSGNHGMAGVRGEDGELEAVFALDARSTSRSPDWA